MNKKNEEIISLISAIIGGLLGMIGVIALGIHLGDPAIMRMVYPTTPAPTATATVTPTASPTIQVNEPELPAATPQPGWQVCTGIPDGHLHVRVSAGHEAAVVGVLPETISISPTGQRDGDWIAISAPLVGWVNSKFICEGVQP